jgi:Icc-related predicted phosphoesterase
MKIVALSDTHCKHENITPEVADLYIHAGDCSNSKSAALNHREVINFLQWYSSLPGKKIFVPGNHDTSIYHNFIDPDNWSEITFLIHEYTEIEVPYVIEDDMMAIETVKVFGSPYTPEFGIGWAYNYKRKKGDQYWNFIPKDIDILVTHGPAFGILDATKNRSTGNNVERVGCKMLFNHIQHVQPKYHIFGHLHYEKTVYNPGILKIPQLKTTFVNAACVDQRHNIIHQGITL